MKRYLFIVMLLTINIANAALIDRGNGLIFDPDLNITWMKDANYALTSGYIDGISTEYNDGRMTFEDVNIWIAQLTYAGFSDWRLPSTEYIDPSCGSQLSVDGFNYSSGISCSNSEMGHLFYDELGGVVDQKITESNNENINMFINIQDSGAGSYWSSQILPWGEVYGFNFYNGHTIYGNVANQRYAWLVHDGDIATVPVPAAIWLFVSGLLGFFVTTQLKLKNFKFL